MSILAPGRVLSLGKSKLPGCRVVQVTDSSWEAPLTECWHRSGPSLAG